MPSNATIEFGHTYAPERLASIKTPGAPQEGLIANEKTLRIRQIIDTIGSDATRVALVDDVVANERKKKSVDSWRWALFIGVCAESVRFATGAEIVEYESSFVTHSRKLVDKIRGTKLPPTCRISADGNKIIQGTGRDKKRIPLVGFSGVEDQTYPSCQVLDLAWLQYRHTLADSAITVLPRSYDRQQKQVSILAGIIGIDPWRNETIFEEDIIF